MMRCWLCFLPLLALVACKAPPPEDPNAVDWGSYEEAKAPPPPPPKAEPAPPAPAPRQPPRQIPVVSSQEPPFGYTEVIRPNWELVAIGYSIFAATYLAPVPAAVVLGGNAWTMLVPVAGPILQMVAMADDFSDRSCCDLYQAGALGIAFSGLAILFAAQTAGLVIGTSGLLEKKPYWVRSDLALVRTPSLDLRLHFSGSALQLNGRF